MVALQCNYRVEYFLKTTYARVPGTEKKEVPRKTHLLQLSISRFSYRLKAISKPPLVTPPVGREAIGFSRIEHSIPEILPQVSLSTNEYSSEHNQNVACL